MADDTMTLEIGNHVVATEGCRSPRDPGWVVVRAPSSESGVRLVGAADGAALVE